MPVNNAKSSHLKNVNDLDCKGRQSVENHDIYDLNLEGDSEKSYCGNKEVLIKPWMIYFVYMFLFMYDGSYIRRALMFN